MPLLRHLALLLLSLSLAAAQAPAPPSPSRAPVISPPAPAANVPPGGTVPGAAPAAAAGAPAAERKPVRAAAVRDPNVPLGETKIVEPIEEVTLKGSELAILYRKYTGRRVIVAAAAATTEFSFIQDASPQDPLTYAQAAELLKKAAGIENFVFIPDEKDPNLDILAVSTRPTGIGYDVFNENSPLPEGDAVITYVMTFKHLKPETAAQAFTQIIGQFGTYGSIAPLNGSVVITENTSLIRRLIKLKEEIDKPADVTGTRFIMVKYADVTELAGTLNELLNTQQQAQKTAAIQRAAVTPSAAPVPGAPPQNAVVTPGAAATSTDTPVQIIPEPRTNRVFVMGRPVDLLFVEGLIREFDIETSEKTFLRRKLKFLTVSDFLPIAEDALNRAFTSSTEGGAGAAGAAGGARSGSNSRTNSASRSNSANRGGAATTGAATGNNSFGGGSSSFGGSGAGGSSGSSSGAASSTLGSPNASTAPESRLVGRTLLVADNITNSIIVQGPPSGLEIVQRLLDQVDVKADQVMISSVIGQLTLNDSKTFGLDYLYLDNNGNAAGRGGGGVGPILPIEPIPNPSPGGNPIPFNRGSLTAVGGLKLYGKIGNNLNVYLQALQSTGNFTILSRPSIFTANNQKGVISSGRRVAIPTNSNSFNNGGASTNIQYQDVVLKLEVIPLINSKDEITLQIALLDDEVNGNQTIEGAGANGATLTVPNIFTREILTTVTVPNNETIVLGGLISDTKTDKVDGIPILSSIPFLGKLFSNTVKTNTREELLIFIQPSIITSRSSLDNVQGDMDRRYKATASTRKFADGPGGLPAPDVAPVSDKGAAIPKAKPVVPQPAPSPLKKSISPGFRG
ncbi:MAG: secretin N-terminal domain-containing protein [Verrucomicrobiota bacterium]